MKKFKSKDRGSFVNELNLEILKKEFDEGSTQAYYKATVLCQTFNHPTPEWLREATKIRLEHGEFPGKKESTPAKIALQDKNTWIRAAYYLAIDLRKYREKETGEIVDAPLKNEEAPMDCADLAAEFIKIAQGANVNILSTHAKNVHRKIAKINPSPHSFRKQYPSVKKDDLVQKKIDLLTFLQELGYFPII